MNKNDIINTYRNVASIYERFGDDLSKRFFLARLKYSLTGNACDLYRLLINIDRGEKIDDLITLLQRNMREQKDKIVLYGTNSRSRMLFNSISSLGIKISYTISEIDSKGRPHEYDFMGNQCLTIEELINRHRDAKVIIGVAAFHKIRDLLLARGFSAEQVYLRKTKWSVQYFEKDICVPGEHEVFVDGGSWNMNDSVNFIKWANDSYDAIYAFEPDPDSFEHCLTTVTNMPKHNQIKCKIFNAGLWREKSQMAFSNLGSVGSKLTNDGDFRADFTSIDLALQGDRATFIKMDIEGAEMEALKGAQETIKKFKPRLAICIYHKPEDILNIPLYIMELVPEYKFFIRHYTTFTAETVLYCV